MAGTKPNPHTPADRRLAENRGLPPHQVSERAWSEIKASDYADAQDYNNSCLIPGDGKNDAKTGKLPVREPAAMGGKLNRNACHSAASVLAGGMGGLSAVSPADKKAAAKLLLRYYKLWLKEPAPASLVQMAN